MVVSLLSAKLANQNVNSLEKRELDPLTLWCVILYLSYNYFIFF